MKIPKHLEPFNNGDLVNFREFGYMDKQKEIEYQVHDRVLHHVARADSRKMAQFIVDSINQSYKISIVH